MKRFQPFFVTWFLFLMVEKNIAKKIIIPFFAEKKAIFTTKIAENCPPKGFHCRQVLAND